MQQIDEFSKTAIPGHNIESVKDITEVSSIKTTIEESLKQKEKDDKQLKTIKDNSFSKIFLRFLKDFVKFFGIRAAFILSKCLLIRAPNANFLEMAFSLSSFKSVLCVSSLQLLYKLLMKMFGNMKYGVFLSGFISGFISINMEEKTNLVQFIILSLFARFLHAAFLTYNKETQFDLPGKMLEFSLFLVINTTIIALSFLIPHFNKLTHLVDTHNNKTHIEAYEVDHIRRIIKLV